MKANYNLRTPDFVIPEYNTVIYGKHSIRYLGPIYSTNYWEMYGHNVT